METVLTLGLVSVILGTASGAQNLGVFGALGVGGYIALAGLWGSPISGTSMNPARTFGPDLVGADFTAYWVYIAGPLLGAAIAVGFAFVLRGRGEVGPAPGPPRAHCSRLRKFPTRDDRTVEPARYQERRRRQGQPGRGNVVRGTSSSHESLHGTEQTGSSRLRV